MSWSLNCDWILSLSVSKSISSSCASGPRNDFNLHLCTLNGGQLYSQNRRWQSGQWVFSLLHILIGSPHRELHSLIFYCTTLLNTSQRGGQPHKQAYKSSLKSLEVADDSSYHPCPYNQGLFFPSNRVSIAPAGTAWNNTSWRISVYYKVYWKNHFKTNISTICLFVILLFR